MAHQEVSGIAAVHSPAGTFAAAPASRSVKPEAADDHEDVSVFGINGNPVPGAFLPVIQEKPGMAGGREQTGFLQHKGSAAGTVIMSIIMPPVPPAQPVRLVDQGIGCRNGALDLRRGISGGNGFPVVQHGRLAGHKVVGGKTRRSFNLLLGGTGREKKAGQKGTSHGESSVGRKCHKNYKLRNSRPLGKKIITTEF